MWRRVFLLLPIAGWFVCVCVSPIEERKESEEKRRRRSIRPPVTGLKRPSGPVFDGYLILHRPPYLMSAIYTKWGPVSFFFFLFLVLFPSYREKKEKTFDSCRSSYNIYHATPNLLVVVIISWNDANNTHTYTTWVYVCVLYICRVQGPCVCCTHLIVSDSCVLYVCIDCSSLLLHARKANRKCHYYIMFLVQQFVPGLIMTMFFLSLQRNIKKGWLYSFIVLMARAVCIPSIKNVMNWNKVKKFNAHRSNSFLVNSFAFVGPGPARSGRPLRKWRWGSYRQLNRRNNHPKKWRENKEEWPDELVEWLLAAIGCCFFLYVALRLLLFRAVAVGYKHAFPCNKCVAALDRT